MTKKIRAVLDTNVFVSAALSKNANSPTRETLDRWKRDEFVLLICTPLAEEIVEKLLDRHVDNEKVVDLVKTLADWAEWVEVPAEKIESLLSDPDDNVIVACAVEGGANYLVTYDPHFDSLQGEYRGVKIVKAIPFLDVLRKQ
ncbi:MAG: putative toxin-antitoxin system toxin component, PIN family [Anaerolineales bacterium]|nr:putative toxin-antitoxin system toxin component, PIN family [Anaerolineales bacterium]MCC6987088.1 putative toxin-antitoxin system toxin component, PIN family [Anaerolineales bacterium]